MNEIDQKVNYRLLNIEQKIGILHEEIDEKIQKA